MLPPETQYLERKYLASHHCFAMLDLSCLRWVMEQGHPEPCSVHRHPVALTYTPGVVSEISWRSLHAQGLVFPQDFPCPHLSAWWSPSWEVRRTSPLFPAAYELYRQESKLLVCYWVSEPQVWLSLQYIGLLGNGEQCGRQGVSLHDS